MLDYRTWQVRWTFFCTKVQSIFFYSIDRRTTSCIHLKIRLPFYFWQNELKIHSKKILFFHTVSVTSDVFVICEPQWLIRHVLFYTMKTSWERLSLDLILNFPSTCLTLVALRYWWWFVYFGGLFIMWKRKDRILSSLTD